MLVQKKITGAQSLNNAVASATLAWNTGGQSETKMLNAFEVEVFPFTKRAIVAKDMLNV